MPQWRGRLCFSKNVTSKFFGTHRVTHCLTYTEASSGRNPVFSPVPNSLTGHTKACRSGIDTAQLSYHSIKRSRYV